MDHADPLLKSVLAAEECRRQALLSTDLEALQGLLADALVYVHSTAASDSKDSYLAKLRSGALRYQALQFDDVQARLLGPEGAAAVVTGRMAAQVLKDGQVRAVRSLFMTVWARSAARDAGGWQLCAHQGTPLPA
mgnify:FL=1